MDFSAEQALAKLQTGVFLVARHEVLKDPNFQGTVILLCSHEKDGDYGLVLNRISHMPLDEVFESLPPDLRGPREVHLGGPVEQDKIQILDWSDEPAPESLRIVDGLTMGGIGTSPGSWRTILSRSRRARGSTVPNPIPTASSWVIRDGGRASWKAKSRWVPGRSFPPTW